MQLALGSAQFGLDYGISNHLGQVSDGSLSAILALARRCGITTLDTAPAYGNAECRLGQLHTGDFKMVSKLLPGITADNVSGALQQTLHNTQRSQLEGLLLHRSTDATHALIEQLLTLQQQNKIGKIGVSLYSPTELEVWLLNGYPLELVQLPANLLDQRFLRSGWLDKLVALGCEIHIRSLFLQGLLLMAPNTWPDYFAPFKEKLLAIATWQPQHSPLAKALCMLNALPQASHVVIGVCSEQELAAIIAAMHTPISWDDNQLASLACADPALINPSLWSKR